MTMVGTWITRLFEGGGKRSSRRPTKLMCEALDHRIVPSVTYFDYTTGGNTYSGWVDYADAGVNAASATQSVSATDVNLTFNGIEYDWSVIDSGATVSFAYGRVVGYSFAVSSPPVGGEHLTVSFSSGTLSITHGDGENSSLSQFYGGIHNDNPPELDTSETNTGSGFRFTLSDGRVAHGEFLLPSANVVSNGSADLTSFTLTIDGETFDINDCDSTPTANFSSGAFTGITFSLSSLGTTGIDSITGSGDTITATISSVAQVKKDKFDQSTVTLNMAGFTTGQNYNVRIEVFQADQGGSVVATFSVGAGDATSQIRANLVKALQKQGVFVVPADPTTPNILVIGGNKAKDKVLGHIDFTLYTAMNGNGDPIPNNNFTGPTYVNRVGAPLAVVNVNGTKISP